MKKAGFNRMYFGVESISQRSLDTLVKDYKAEKVVECLKMMRRAGIWTKIFLIVGTPEETLEDIAVHLSFKDMRRNKAILSKAAREDLTGFTDTFTLVVGQADADGKLLGAYDLASLIKEVFTQRLQHSGIKVVEKNESIAELEISLKDFRLDLKSHSWVFSLGYQLKLFKNGKLMASENTSGDAERLKTLGSREADKVISELVTEMINRLDVVAFMRQAGT